MDAKAILIAYFFYFAWKNTRETQISCHVTKIMFTGVINGIDNMAQSFFRSQ